MPFMVVAVDRDTWCWFDASQVARALERSMPQLPAPPRQLQEADPSGSSEPQGPFGR